MKKEVQDFTNESYIDMYESMSEENRSRYANYILQRILYNLAYCDITKDNIVLYLSSLEYLHNQQSIKNLSKSTNVVFAINNLDLFLRIKNYLSHQGFKTFLSQEDNMLFLSISKSLISEDYKDKFIKK